MTREQIIDGIKDCVAESLSANRAELTPETGLISDLNADSLDFLDIMFALENKFGIKLQKEDFNLMTRLGMAREEAVVDGKLTPKAKEKLIAWLPTLPKDKDLAPNQLGQYLTLQSLVLIVEEFQSKKH
jgi:acyl carrier protein